MDNVNEFRLQLAQKIIEEISASPTFGLLIASFAEDVNPELLASEKFELEHAEQLADDFVTTYNHAFQYMLRYMQLANIMREFTDQTEAIDKLIDTWMK